jgi:hypothetical protein
MRKRGMTNQEEKTKFFCPLFNFEITDNKSKIKSDPKTLHIHMEKNTFKQLNFVGGTILKTMPRGKLKQNKAVFIGTFLCHVADIFYQKLENIPIIEIFEEEKKIVSFLENVETALRIFKDGDVF